MPEFLQKQLRGLSDFTGLFNLGQQPMQLGGIVAPTLDMSAFLEEPRTNTGSQSLNTVATGSFFGTATVPEDEIWRVLQFGGGTPGSVLATAIRMRGVLEIPSGERLGFNGDIAPYLFGGSAQISIGYLFPQVFVALSGWRFGWEVLSNSAVGQPTFTSAVIYQRIKA